MNDVENKSVICVVKWIDISPIVSSDMVDENTSKRHINSAGPKFSKKYSKKDLKK